MNGAQYVVKSLKQQKVHAIFGYPGGQIMPLYDALYESDLPHVLCRHEQGAVMAAIGYARASGKIGVCIATSGPGATNLITGLADALLDSIPIVAITGQVPTHLIGTDAFQEVDVMGLSLACTKHSFLVETIDELPTILQQAFTIAISGRPGPVLIDLPKDIQLAEINSISNPLVSKKSTTPSLNALEQARQFLQQAQKPLLYIGGGIGMAKAIASLRTFIAVTKIPTVTTLKGLGAPDPNHPYYLGLLGMHGSKTANYAVQQCDLLIAVGARFDDRVTGNLVNFAYDANVIHIDIDAAEINKLKQVQIGLIGDLNDILITLQQPLTIDRWQQQLTKMKEEFTITYPKTSRIQAPYLLHRLSKQKPSTAIITTDVGQHQMWAAQHMVFNDPKNFITSSGLGTMGFGLPAAIGAQLARRNDLVITISGDGSFMMNVQELATIKRKQLPIKILLIDNQRLGMVRQWQQLFFSGRYSETDLSDNPDFIMLANAFGIKGESICKTDQIDEALITLLHCKEAYLLHVVIDPNDNVWPLVPPGASNDMMLEALPC